ncbi:beta-galactosidase trimerization domain-containing protein, partial [bacterium]|nr:beta-galactosidase trimerization domain-containing protein [bacterium]
TYAEYDFTKWRGILDSFGGSAHASWHFGNFTRNNYHYAMAANSEIIRSGAGAKPWIMTELQGGNNLWSGGIPMCPTKQEIEQWLWINIGTGAKGMIFWSLNGRSAGIEAGEWALLNLLNQPTDRMEMVGKVAEILKNRADLFSTAKEYESGVNILYTRESLWCERRAETAGANYAGRLPGGAIRSTIGFYETFAQLGIQSNIKCIDEFDFTVSNNKGKVIVLAHQIALPSNFTKLLEQFVATGGTLLVEGLTGFFDEYMHNQTNATFPYAKLFGGLLKDVPFVNEKFNITLSNQKATLPVHLWEGVIQPTTAQPLAKNAQSEILATTNTFGGGKVIWIPTLVDHWHNL